MNKYITIFAALICVALVMPNIGDRAYADTWRDGTPRFRENAASLAQTFGHNGRMMLAPALADALPPPAYKVDNEREFHATNMRNGSQYQLTASCRAVGDRAYIFVESDVSANSGKINSLLTAFDKIYDTITGHFGPPPDSVDGDPRVYILLLDIIDEEGADGANIIGYFDPVNQYQNGQLPRWARWTNQVSNEIEMLYIDYTALDFSPDGAEGVVAHEFTHLVQWARDPEESIWIDEGIAVYVEAMMGYEVKHRVSAFEDEPDTPLLTWLDTLADYGAAYLFFTYISERFDGVATVAAIVKNEDQGTDSIDQSLAVQDKPASFSDIFSDWAVANYLDDPDLPDGIYGYTTADVRLKPSVVEESYPIDSRTLMAQPWIAYYIAFEKENNDALSLTVFSNNGNDIVAQVIEYGDDIQVSAAKSGGAESGTVRISQESQSAILVITVQPDPPEMIGMITSYAYSAAVVPDSTAIVSISEMKITTWGTIKRD